MPAVDAFGRMALAVALGWTVLSGGLAAVAERTHDIRWRESARGGAVGVFLFLTAAIIAFEYLLVSQDYQVAAVFNHTNTTLPMAFRVGALWGGDSGSLLLWAWVLSVYGVFVSWWDAERYPRLANVASVVISGLLAFFIGVDFFVTDPFRLLATRPTNGGGLDPLLQNVVMLVHPPMMYIGLVGMSLPFAYVLAALWLRQQGTEWIPLVRRRMLFAWVLLGSALVLGGMWSYMVLGWGGYWEWDPVENAALLPWIAATLFLHLIQVDMTRHRVQWWTVVTVIGSYLLTLLATWITRSGVLKNSVHSFIGTGIGPYFVWYFWGLLALSAMLLVARRKVINLSFEKVREASRETLLYWFAMAMCWIAAFVLGGTLWPVISKWLFGQTVVLTEHWFNTITVPAFIVVTFLLGLVPYTGWGTVSRVDRRLVWSMAGGFLATWLGAGYEGADTVAGAALFFACGFSIVSISLDVARWIDMRRRHLREQWLRSAGHVLAAQRRRVGAHIVHLAFLIIALGVAGSHLNAKSEIVRIRPGQTVSLAGYRLTYEGLSQENLPGRQLTRAKLAVVDGSHTFTIAAGETVYTGAAQPVANVAIRSGLMHDLYVVLNGWTSDGRQAILQIMVNPMVSWLWIGMYVMIGGTLMVLTRADPMRQDAAERVWELGGEAVEGRG